MALLILFLLLFILKRSKKNKIEKFLEPSDKRFDLSEAERQLSYEIIKNKQLIKKTINESHSKVDTAWIDSISKVMSVSNTLQKNLEMQQKKRLSTNKFHYYVGLHFRSMKAANLVHKEFSNVDHSYREINQLLLSIKNGKTHVSKQEKNDYWNIKELIKETRRVLLERVHQLNYQTGQLRDKIRDECGQRGKDWHAKIMQGRR